MAVISGCNIPEDLYYLAGDKLVWARFEDDGTVTAGVPDPGQAVAGKVVAVTPKKLGRTIARGKSMGTLESGKWVGPIPAPVSGEIIAINEAVTGSPSLINDDPYGEGWIVRLQPSNVDEDKAELVTGQAAADAFQQLMAERDISCQ
jgi:glycine cleavage system H protein